MQCNFNFFASAILCVLMSCHIITVSIRTADCSRCDFFARFSWQRDKKKAAEELTAHGKPMPGYTFWPFGCSYGIQCVSMLLTTNASHMQIIKITAAPSDSKWDLF